MKTTIAVSASLVHERIDRRPINIRIEDRAPNGDFIACHTRQLTMEQAQRLYDQLHMELLAQGEAEAGPEPGVSDFDDMFPQGL